MILKDRNGKDLKCKDEMVERVEVLYTVVLLKYYSHACKFVAKQQHSTRNNNKWSSLCEVRPL